MIKFSKQFSELSRLKKNGSEDSWSIATIEYQGSCFSRTRDEEIFRVVHTGCNGIQERFEIKINNNRCIPESLKIFKFILVTAILAVGIITTAGS